MFNFLPSGTHEVIIENETLASSTPIAIAYPADRIKQGLVIIPDIFGFRPLVKDTITQIASFGVTVIAVEPFSHIIDDLSTATRQDKLARINEMDDNVQCADILAAGQILREKYLCENVGLIGFCIGGMYAFKCAGTGQFDAVVSCYGMITLPQDWKGIGQKEPMHYVKQDTCSRLLAIVGGKDHGYAHVDDVQLLMETLSSSHHQQAGSSIEIFPEAGHAFMHDPQRAEHRPADALIAWKHAFDFLGFL